MNRLTAIDYYAAAAGIFACLLIGWILLSHFEARAFNRVTGAEVSTWDAMFIELRVISDRYDKTTPVIEGEPNAAGPSLR